MRIKLIETKSKQKIEAAIEKALGKDMPLKKNGWQFTWKTLYKTEGASFYKLIILSNPDDVEGVLMFSLMNEEMLYMNNIEVAPHNYGAKGKYDHIAGCLIAYACLKSIELGRNVYKGYLTFESKTALIPLYQNKYGARLAMGQRMFIDPNQGLQLIKQYLNIKL